MTLLQCIDQLIETISVTDRQEENIKASLSNLDGHLRNKDNGLYVRNTFTTGSYDRDTIIRPLKDIDLFAVLNFEKWKDQYGNLPDPQSVLSKIRNYLNDQKDYEGKVRQDRPCVTVELSNKDFDILPSFEQQLGGYLIPNFDLKSWTYSYPEQLAKSLDDIHRLRNYKVKQVIKVAKYWNRENGALIPSYHIEEAAINIFQVNAFTNFEEAIRILFNSAEYNLHSNKFKSSDEHLKVVNKIRKVKDKLATAKSEYDEGREEKALEIWKGVFGDEFPSADSSLEAEAKRFSKSLSEGNLKIGSSGVLSTLVGLPISASKGYYGDVPKA